MTHNIMICCMLNANSEMWLARCNHWLSGDRLQCTVASLECVLNV